MKIFLDTANLDHIRQGASLGVLEGVTTNPTLIAKEKPNDWVAHVKEICAICEGPVSIETVTATREELVEEGRWISSIAPNAIVKLAVVTEALAACKTLAGEGIRSNVTLVFQPAQALLAAKAGAYIVSPFLGRLDDISQDGLNLLSDIVAIYDRFGFETEILAASLRHPIHVVESAKIGADIGSMPYDVFEKLIKHPLTDSGLKRFLEDWESVKDAMGTESKGA